MKLNLQLFAATDLSTGGVAPKLTPDFFNTEEYQLQLKENFIVIFETNDILGQDFELVAESVTLPQRQVEQIAVPYANKNINIAGRNTFTNMTIVVRDVISKDTELLVEKWMEKTLKLKDGTRGSIGDSTGKNGYKINLSVIPLAPNGDKGRPSIAKGCFIVSTDFGELSYVNSGLRTFSIELSVDDFGRKELFD